MRPSFPSLLIGARVCRTPALFSCPTLVLVMAFFQMLILAPEKLCPVHISTFRRVEVCCCYTCVTIDPYVPETAKKIQQVGISCT